MWRATVPGLGLLLLLWLLGLLVLGWFQQHSGPPAPEPQPQPEPQPRSQPEPQPEPDSPDQSCFCQVRPPDQTPSSRTGPACWRGRRGGGNNRLHSGGSSSTFYCVLP